MSLTSWSQIASLATKAGSKYPELCAAQWALESGWGKYLSGKNNVYGIKGKGTKKVTTEFVNGKEVQVTDEFMDFASIEDCVQYLVDRWYKDYANRYKGVNNAATREDAARMLVSEGYATDPAYAEKLIALMNNNSVPRTTVTPNTAASGNPVISVTNAARHFAELQHQIDAFEYLQSVLTKEELSEFAKRFRASDDKIQFPLNVPYFYQRDSKTGHGERSCQASALAMVIKYLDPGMIKDDDDYLNLVFRYGDTVSQNAHGKALDHLGLKYKFSTTGTEKDLTDILDQGYPVPIGILHKGNINNPSGGGHYITLTGYDDKCFYVHDPFGELDLVNGTYPKSGPVDGKAQKYTRKNLMKRWLIQSNSDGWYWDLRGNK